ncbi:hypothetical protein F5Y04DRAFT_177208 [Hypomontagnella monticulosa]|nr:hypothetical protein F5Y04DRAFT_177208 [Hypomontagnella monticulosa]
MPSFRGIEVSIVASSDVRNLPEYPHPDGSSVRLMRVGAGLNDFRNGGQISPRLPASFSYSDVDPTRKKKVNPRISVYIPSSPGAQFRLRYFVNKSSVPSRFVFFKMFVNGYHAVSWGIDAESCPAGSVTRSLYEPGDGFKDENGDTVVGMETRYFHFTHAIDKNPAGEDGGLIEVQVFRCRGRKRIAVVLDSYPNRQQGRHGIVSPSGGLVDNPQDATFYEYHLEDARDSPYATFCFHYRSKRLLGLLNLLPQQETRYRPVSVNSIATLVPDAQGHAAQTTPSPSTPGFTFGIEGSGTRIIDGGTTITGAATSESSEAASLDEYSPSSLPPRSPTRRASVVVGDTKQMRRCETVAEMLQRPLPELPRTVSRRVSKESVRSSCPSLTPSLKQYVKSEEFETDEIKLGMAQPISIRSESIQKLELSDESTHEQDDNSFSDYAASVDSEETSHSPVLPPPEGYVPTTGSVLERQFHQFDSPIAQLSFDGKAKLTGSLSEGALVGGMDVPRASTFRLSEAEWLGRSPSPLRREGSLISRLWSPRPRKRAGRSSSMGELLTRGRELGNTNNSSTNARSSARCDSGSDSAPIGNWI